MFKPVTQLVITNWNSRQLVFDMIKRDFKIKFLGSMLGSYWNFIHPLAMITIYTVIFSKLMHSRIGSNHQQGPFAFTIYLCAGLLPWTAFSEMVTRGTLAFQENANFIKKMSFPKEILQSVATGSSLITLLINLSIYFLFSLVVGTFGGKALITIPLAIGCQILFASGLGMIFSVLNVFFRDVQQFIGILFQVWFWMTPIVYLPELIPEKFQIFLHINPMYYIIRLYQQGFYEQVFPSAHLILMALSSSILTYMGGCYFIWQFKDEIVDEL